MVEKSRVENFMVEIYVVENFTVEMSFNHYLTPKQNITSKKISFVVFSLPNPTKYLLHLKEKI